MQWRILVAGLLVAAAAHLAGPQGLPIARALCVLLPAGPLGDVLREVPPELSGLKSFPAPKIPSRDPISE